MNAMTTLVKENTPLEAMDKVYKDTTEVSIWLSLFVTGFMNVMIKRYLNPLSQKQVEKLSIEAEPPISTLSFFSSPPLPRNQEQ